VFIAISLRVDFDEPLEGEGGEESGFNYRDMMKRERRRWARADRNNDGELNKEEYSDFLHPEEVDHMKDVIIDVCTLYTHTPTLR